MEDNHDHRQEKQKDPCPEPTAHERRKDHRRTHASKGYAYIQMVGWMDRRERIRRDDDPTSF